MELDCYVIDLDKPVRNLKARCIAVVKRLNDNEDKLIVVEKDMEYSDKEILEKVNFQEKFFISELIR